MDQEGHDRVTDDRTDDPVPMTSPSTAQISFPFGSTIEYPGEKRTKDSACECQRRIPIKDIRMIPIKVAQSREYQGPMNTEQAMLMRWAMGHIPSMRRMGEMTTPMAISMASIVIRRISVLLFMISSFRPAVIALDYDGTVERARWGRLRPYRRTVEAQKPPLTLKHKFPAVVGHAEPRRSPQLRLHPDANCAR